MNKQDSIGDRLKEWVSSKESSASDFAKKIQIQRSALSHIFSGRNNPSVDVLLKIKNAYPELSLDWLITGEIKAQIRIEKSKKSASDVEIDDDKFTSVNLIDLDSENQHVKTNDQSEIKSQSKNRIPVRIIELYSDGTFRYFDS